MLAFLATLLVLPIQVPISAVLLRAAFSLEMRLVMPDVDEIGTEATWGRSFLTSLSTHGAMLIVGFVIALCTQVFANLALIAPMYTVGLTISGVLVAQWAVQGLMARLILQLRWRRALRVSLYQILISVLIAAVCGGIVMALMAAMG